MQTHVRRLLATALAIALVGSVLAPAVQAAAPPHPSLSRSTPLAVYQPPRHTNVHGQIIAWAPRSLGTITVRRGETVIRVVRFTNLLPLTDVRIHADLSRFAHGARLRLLYTSVRQGQGLYRDFRIVKIVFAVTASVHASIGMFGANLHVDGRVRGRGRFRALPNDLYFRVDVDYGRPHRPPLHPLIRWTPRNNLGVITIRQGQTVTERASLTSNVRLTDARIVKALNEYASARGLYVRVAPIPTNIQANTSVPVTFSITAGRYAVVRSYNDALAVVGRPDGKQLRPLRYVLRFVIDVDRATAQICWTPSTLGVITVQQGQTVTETASFESSANLSAARIVKALNEYASARGLYVRVMPIPTSIAANTPVPVTFTITAGRYAVVRGYNDALYVVASAGGPVMVLHLGLHFVIDVDRLPVAQIRWTPATLGTITVLQGQTVTETATFTSSADLTDARIVKALNDYASARGLYVQVMPIPASISANTPVAVTFTITAGRYAVVRGYNDALYVVGRQDGGPLRAFHFGLHFVVDVDRATAQIRWTPSTLGVITVQQGQTVTETASFESSANLSAARIVKALNEYASARGLYVQVMPIPATISANTPVPVTFTITAGRYAVVRGYNDALYVVASAGGPAMALHLGLHFVIDVERVPVAQIRWTPATLGTITVQQGQTVTETATFTSSADLMDARIVKALNEYASARGLYVQVMPIPTSIAANTSVPVTFTITAGRYAVVRGYDDALYVVGRQDGGPLRAFHLGLHFVVDVERATAEIRWTPVTLGTITLQQGQTVTETATFTSSADLTDARIVRAINDVASDHGLYVQVTPIPTNIPANTPVVVTFTITAGRYAVVRGYNDALYVVASAAGPVMALHLGLHFVIDVDRVPVAQIRWTPATLGTITLLQGQTVTETATFTSSADLTNARIVRALNDIASDHGVYVQVAPIPTSISANTPVPVTFTITAGRYAVVRGYNDALYVVGSQNGGAVQAFHLGLHFIVDVDRAPVVTPVAVWAGGTVVTYPAIVAGTAVTETASFTTNVDLTNASLTATLGRRVPGLTLTVAPLAGTTIAANTPTTVSFTINATGVPARFKGGLYTGLIQLVGQPASADRPIVIHMGLHFSGAVS